MDEETIHALVSRLARRHSSGGEVIERAAILAAGADSAAVLAWIAAHDGQPEERAVATSVGRGLHSERLNNSGAIGSSVPRRYVFPPGALAQVSAGADAE